MSHLSPKLSKAKLVMELDFFEQFSNTVNTVDTYEFTVHIQIAKNVGLQTAFCYRFLLDNLTICNVASSFKFLELLRTWKECLREF